MVMRYSCAELSLVHVHGHVETNSDIHLCKLYTCNLITIIDLCTYTYIFTTIFSITYTKFL